MGAAYKSEAKPNFLEISPLVIYNGRREQLIPGKEPVPEAGHGGQLRSERLTLQQRDRPVHGGGVLQRDLEPHHLPGELPAAPELRLDERPADLPGGSPR
jgi:hypothetical protein